MKKILGVVGSPRRMGNTHILVKRILDGAKEEGALVDEIFLRDLNISECDGCHVCWGGLECSKLDDMNSTYQKIIDSDIIIFGTPVYWYGPTALMKGFIDRFVYFNCQKNRSKIRGKSAVIAVPFEEDNPLTAALVVAFFEKCFEYLEIRLVGKVIAPGVGFKGEILKKKDRMDEAFLLGKNLALGIQDV